MKRLVSLFVASIIYVCMANAQVDNTLQFVDENGNIVSDGSTIEGKLEYVDDGFQQYYQVSSGLYVKNNANTDTGVGVDYTINSIGSGTLNCCFPSNCVPRNKVGDYQTENGFLTANETRSFQTEWIPEQGYYGTCSATFKLKVMDMKEEEIYGVPIVTYVFKAYGPSVTVNFTYNENSTGIADITENDKKISAYYTLDGKEIKEPQKGINIVKYANGKTTKVVVK